MSDIFLGVFEMSDAKRLQNIAADSQIQLELRSNPQTCTRGCKVTVELWGEEKDLKFLSDLFRKEQLRDLPNAEINFEALDSVYDPNAQEVTCQACGHKFSPDKTECPDCGLVYG
ncbi:MAG: hypothetical protein ACOCUH_00725 [Bacteriovoracia bacterium]